MAVVKEQVKSLKSEIDTLYEAMRNEIERRLFQSASHRCVAIPCATITSDTIVNIQERHSPTSFHYFEIWLRNFNGLMVCF